MIDQLYNSNQSLSLLGSLKSFGRSLQTNHPINEIGKKTGKQTFNLIEHILLTMILAWESLILMVNYLGLAWWAKIETCRPDVTYWVGPFLSKKGLESQLSTFIDEISSENPGILKQEIVRGCCKEPLTRTHFITEFI